MNDRRPGAPGSGPRARAAQGAGPRRQLRPARENAAFARKHGFPFPLLTDERRVLALAFGAARDAGQRYASRVSVLLDEEGKVLRLYPNVKPREHAAEVLRDLDARR